MKKAVLSMDVEDWYHLDYFNQNECDKSQTMLDGLDVFLELLDSLSIKSSFFVLGEIANKKINLFKDLTRCGHDISSHGWDHKRPMKMTLNEFHADLKMNVDLMKKINGDIKFGYRAPCFSIDRQRLDLIKESGFSYDSSRIDFGNHPLYGSIDMKGYKNITNSIYSMNNFIEFEITTHTFFKKNIPISGGGYLRLLPWPLFNGLVRDYLLNNDLYVLYIHPFELSKSLLPLIPNSTSPLTKFRFSHGRKNTLSKIKKLIDALDSKNYEFTTFNKIYQEITKSSGV